MSWAFAFSLLVLIFILTDSSASPSSSCPYSSEHHSHDHHMVTPPHDHDHSHHEHDHMHEIHEHHEDSIDHGHHNHEHVHGHGCNHDHDHHHHHKHSPDEGVHIRVHKLAEELAEEEELRIYGFKSDIHLDKKHHHEHLLPSLGLWLRALGCSLLVSMASLICLVLLPLIVAQGKLSRVLVDFLAAFGAGAMLGDAFLHQLPHALGGGHSHSHGAEHDYTHANHHDGHGHQHHEGMGGHGHSHSIQDLSVGLAVLAGIILFFIVEKIVREVEKGSSRGTISWVHHHHHHHPHHHRHHEHDDDTQHPEDDGEETGDKHESISKDDARIEGSPENSTNGHIEEQKDNVDKPYRRKKMAGVQEKLETTLAPSKKDESEKKPTAAEESAAPNLVLGYLNLFSDGVHNFTDGMALGAAFLNHGTLGGWSRTLFLLAHELPQEVGDFGILVQSGFSVFKALAFNFLSALVALAGTAMALLLGGSPGHSSLIEGFTAGGFIYIAVAGVLPEMHQHGTSTKVTCLQLVALMLGMSVALSISLVE